MEVERYKFNTHKKKKNSSSGVQAQARHLFSAQMGDPLCVMTQTPNMSIQDKMWGRKNRKVALYFKQL